MSPAVLVDTSVDVRQPDTHDMVATLAALRAIDPAAMSPRELQRAASSIRSVRCWLDALGAQLLTALAATADGPAAVIEVLAVEGVSAAEIRRRRRVAAGCVLAPEFAAALASGRITAEHVAALANVRNRESIPGAADGLLAQAVGASPEDFTRGLTAWDDALDEANGVSPAAIRHRKRGATFTTRADGMGVIHVVLPALEHAIVHDAVMRTADGLWRHSGDRESTPTQRYADALVAIAGGVGAMARPHAGASPADSDSESESPSPSSPAESSSPPDPAPPESPAPPSASSSARRRTPSTKAADDRPNRPPSGRAKLLVVVNELDLRGSLATAGLAHTADGQPISIAEARRLACISGLTPIVLNGASQPLDLGRERRLVSPAQWHALIAGRPHCIVAGCAATIHHLEAHHCLPWEHQGPTDLANLCLACHTHHRATHHLGWTITPNLDGTFTCRTPGGTIVPTRTPRGAG